jgi:hypothetical protein
VKNPESSLLAGTVAVEFTNRLFFPGAMTFFASFDPWCELFGQKFLLDVLSFQRGDLHPLLGDDELKG